MSPLAEDCERCADRAAREVARVDVGVEAARVTDDLAEQARVDGDARRGRPARVRRGERDDHRPGYRRIPAMDMRGRGRQNDVRRRKRVTELTLVRAQDELPEARAVRVARGRLLVRAA